MSHVPLFEWDTIEECANVSISKCAEYLKKLAFEFKRVSQAYRKLDEDHRRSERECKDLQTKLEKYRNRARCECYLRKNSVEVVGKSLDPVPEDNQENINNDFNLSKVKTEPENELFTQMEHEDEMLLLNMENIQNDQPISANNLKIKIENDSPSFGTPPKRSRLQDVLVQRSEESIGEIEDTFAYQMSPILKKTRSIKNSLSSDSDSSKKTPLRNLTNSSQELDIFPLSNEDKTSESLLGSPTMLDVTLDPFISKLSKKDEVRSKIKPSQNSTGTKGKKLKQSRLTVTKIKPKLSLDVSRAETFCGGVRSGLNKQNEAFVQNEMANNDEDPPDNVDANNVIGESPSCLQRPKKAISESVKAKSNIEMPEPFRIKVEMTSDNDETMCYIPENDFRPSRVATPRKNLKTPSPNKLNIQYYEKPNEFVYKEDPIRKKADKKKAQGWSCQKCGDFYNVAFKGNEEMIQQKIHECSKHRGKFNPERRNTPPGFWDMNMPPTQDTEAFNRRNNRL